MHHSQDPLLKAYECVIICVIFIKSLFHSMKGCDSGEKTIKATLFFIQER